VIEAFAERRRQLAQEFERTAQCLHQYIEEATQRGTPASPAASDRKAAAALVPSGEPHLRWALGQAHVRMTVVQDQWFALAASLPSDQQVLWAIQVLVRASLESCARVWWLCEPELNLDQRLQRSLIEKLADLDEYHSASRALVGEHHLAVEEIDAKRNGIITQATAYGLSKPEGRHGSKGFGKPRPSNKAIVSDLLRAGGLEGAKIVYSLYSSPAHGALWGPAQVLEPHPETDGLRISNSAIAQSIDTACTVAAVGLVHAMHRWGDYLGLPADPWNDRARELILTVHKPRPSQRR
jgi:hypothetical protein